MSSENFSTIAKRYKETSIVQKSAADMLLSLLDIKKGENVLDVGCGTGNLTKRIFDIARNRTVGIDLSEGMVYQSRRSFGNAIQFRTMKAEDIPFENEFDVILCNSTFQWIKDVDKAIANFYRALKRGGRVGIQAPAKNIYCPNFVEAVSELSNDPATKKYYQDFVSPWFFLDTAAEYAQRFAKQGFRVAFSEIQKIETYHSPEETYRIFASGAVAGYLNKECYRNGFDESYSSEFQRIVKEAFHRQATNNGEVKLIFNRIYLVAMKE